MGHILQITDLTKRRPGFFLDHLTLHVPAGSIVGLIGENGAGKTTLMDLILNAVPRDGGNISIFGQDAFSHEKAVKQRIGVVQDECHLPLLFSPGDIESVLRRLYTHWDAQRYRALLQRFGLPPTQAVGSFSKGMKVKLSFAVALAHHAELLLLDEATSGLDPVMRHDILDLLREFVQSGKGGVLLSTHILSDLSQAADYIALLHKGKLRFFLSKSDLLCRCGLLHCKEDSFQSIAPADMLAWRKQDGAYQVLVLDREHAARMYPSCTIVPPTLDDVMLLYSKGGAV